jgi:hypothetical protein
MVLIVVNLIPDAPKAVNNMRRVTKSVGVVATTMRDGSRANELNQCLWDTAIAIDPANRVFRAYRYSAEDIAKARATAGAM